MPSEPVIPKKMYRTLDALKQAVNFDDQLTTQEQIGKIFEILDLLLTQEDEWRQTGRRRMPD